jgi:hypothetical protein
MIQDRSQRGNRTALISLRIPKLFRFAKIHRGDGFLTHRFPDHRNGAADDSNFQSLWYYYTNNDICTAWSFRGATEGGEPGIHNPGRGLWIPGSRAKARAPE